VTSKAILTGPSKATLYKSSVSLYAVMLNEPPGANAPSLDALNTHVPSVA